MHNNSSMQEQEKLHRNILTSVSHDLKTPLACIIGSLEIFERAKERLTAEEKDILINTSLQEAYRLNSFITNILDMAKFEQGMVKPFKEPYEMNLLIKDCLLTMGLRLKSCAIEINDTAIPVVMVTDHLLLERALCILLDNAAKYCPPCTSIKIKYERIGDLVAIRVEDNGPGIPKAKMEDIFCKYLRLSKHDCKIAGSGLGLTICREIMRLLGGTVTVANCEDGKGAMFTLTFKG